MNRKAIIICAPGTKGAKGYLEGALKDAQIWSNYLKSLEGGEWYSWEIEVFINESKAVIKNYIDSCVGDYAFVVFSGHGFVSSTDKLTYCKIRENEYLSENELIPKNILKRTISIDACRDVTDPANIMENLVKGFQGAQMSTRTYRKSTRAYFDNHIALNTTGTIILYGADKNEEAGEDSNGGYYTQALVEAGLRHGQNSTNTDVYDVYDGLISSKIIIKKFTDTQNPQISFGRRNYYFPFAVKVWS